VALRGAERLPHERAALRRARLLPAPAARLRRSARERPDLGLPGALARRLPLLLRRLLSVGLPRHRCAAAAPPERLPHRRAARPHAAESARARLDARRAPRALLPLQDAALDVPEPAHAARRPRGAPGRGGGGSTWIRNSLTSRRCGSSR